MKKIIYAIFAVMIMLTACEKVDNTTTSIKGIDLEEGDVKLVLPIINQNDIKILKQELFQFTDEISEYSKENRYYIKAVITKHLDVCPFSEITFEFTDFGATSTKFSYKYSTTLEITPALKTKINQIYLAPENMIKPGSILL